MARIRSVKPEFWDVVTAAALQRHAREFLIAACEIADDEGLLAWDPAWFEADREVRDATDSLVSTGLVLPYRVGRERRRLAWLVEFDRLCDPATPRVTELPPPSIQNGRVWMAYQRRDRFICHICGGTVNRDRVPPPVANLPRRPGDPRLNPSLDHVVPRYFGGSNYPSNIRLAHQTCNKARRERPIGASPSRYAPQLAVA